MSIPGPSYPCLLMVVGNLCPVLSSASTPSAKELLLASDRARGGLAQGVSWEIVLEWNEGSETAQRSFSVSARGNDARVEAMSPGRRQGDVFLFNDRTLWFFNPRASKRVSIPARRFFSGQIAHGDLAGANYARDYSAKILGEETLNGERVYQLLLKARSKQVTYSQIRYFVSVDRKLAVRADFLNSEGDPLKSAVFEYGNRLEIEGRSSPFVSKMIVSSASFPEDQTTVSFYFPRVQTQPFSIFNAQHLKVH